MLAAQWVAAVAIVVLLALDSLPALHGVPMVVLGLMATAQMGRELGGALARRKLYPSTPVMNFWGAIVLLHCVYFARAAHYSTAIELLNTIFAALFLLVFVAAGTTEAQSHQWGSRVRDMSLALAIPTILGLGLGAGAWLQSGAAHQVTEAGSRLIALLVAAHWLGAGAAAVADRVGLAAGERAARVPASSRGLLARVLATVAGAVLAAGVSGALPVGVAAAAGLAGGVAGWLGHRLLDTVARACDVDRFHHRLPLQISFLQPAYDRCYDGGMLDYAGALVLALPAMLAAVHFLSK